MSTPSPSYSFNPSDSPKGSYDLLTTALAPLFKYVIALLVCYIVATKFNSMIEDEANAKELERKRPHLQPGLMDPTADHSNDENDSEDEIHQELTTDGNTLIETNTKKEKKSTSHPLFEGLQKIEQEMRQQRQEEAKEEQVSWNDLHESMLKRYQDKFPGQGLRTSNGNEDYDNEFKELLKENNIDIEQIRQQRE